MAIGDMYVDKEGSAVWWPFHEINGRTYLALDRFQPKQAECLLTGRMIDFFKIWSRDPYATLAVVSTDLPLPTLLARLAIHSVVPFKQLEPYLDWLNCINNFGRNHTLARVQQNLNLVQSVRMVTLNLGYLSAIQKMPPDLPVCSKTPEYWH